MVPLTGLEPVRDCSRQILSAFAQKVGSGNYQRRQTGTSTLNPHGYTVSRHRIRRTRIVTGFSEKAHFSENLS